MEQNENTSKIGLLIKQLRKQKNLSQRALCRSEEICTVRHLRKIENKGVTPTQYVLNQLLSVLGVDVIEFQAMLYGTDLRQFNSDFDELWEIGFSGDDEAYMQKLEELKRKSHCDLSIPAIKQTIMLCDANELSKIHKEHDAGLDMLYKALRITAPNILYKNNAVNYDKLSERILTMNEYRIIKLIAVVKTKLNQQQEALNIGKAIVASLENNAISFDIQRKLLPSNYFNLSYDLLDEKDYISALHIVDKALKFCNDTNNYKILGKLRYNKARALHGMGDIEQSRIFFVESYNTFKIIRDHKNAEDTKKFAKEKYNISINDD